MRFIIKSATMLLQVFLCFDLSAQEGTYESPVTYELGKVEVIGAKYSDPEAIVSVSGLKVGQKISIPGDHINKAMKAIWNLQLFKDIEIRKTKTISDVVFLEIEVFELPRLSSYIFKGIKKSETEALRQLVKPHLPEGRIFTKHNRQNSIHEIKVYYEEKGYPNAVVIIRESEDPNRQNAVRLNFEIDKRDKVKVMRIEIEGNDNFSDRKLKKLMTFTNEKKKIFKKSILTEEGFKEDKKGLVYFYKTKGFQDAKIISDRIEVSDEGDWIIYLTINEGEKYFFGNIDWKGNSFYSTPILQEILGIKEGDTYDPFLLAERLQFSPEGRRNISSLYMDHGHLFFKINAEEISIEKNEVDLEIKIEEGPVARIGKVIISGNSITSEEIIRREIRTLPGDRFSRAAIIRSQREIINLGFFNPETLDVNTIVHPKTGTVDLEYILEERSSDQFELSAGWDPASRQLIGTLGLSFNNISLKNIFKKSAWNPFPRGDGQKLSFRIQSTGKNYQSYNFSFTNPWLGGKRPTNLTFGGFFTNRRFDSSEGVTQRYNILGLSANISSRMQWPDDNFISSTSVNFNRITLDDWEVDGFQLEDGTPLSDGIFNNFYIRQTFARNTLNHPIFPTRGSSFSLALQFTPPYSLFSKGKKDETPQERYKWLEYYKARFDAQVYVPL